uniref:Uncharacterized protein n=1 Tax=Leersia perrieri TaxID=77586 RepID=A0A0D9VNM9_9ORYZ
MGIKLDVGGVEAVGELEEAAIGRLEGVGGGGGEGGDDGGDLEHRGAVVAGDAVVGKGLSSSPIWGQERDLSKEVRLTHKATPPQKPLKRFQYSFRNQYEETRNENELGILVLES